MPVIDIVILVIFIGAAIYGFWRGLTLQFGSLLGLLMGILACRLFGEKGAGIIRAILPQIGDSASVQVYVSDVIANIVLFILGFFLTKVVAKAVKAAVDALFMGVVDRILGAVFSIFMWMMVLSICLNIWQMFSSTSVIASSRLGGGLAAKAVIDLAPAVFGFTELHF